MYVGNEYGADFICGACEEGLCVHMRKVSGFSWEDTDGCAQCGEPARLRTVASLAESGRISQARQRIMFNPTLSLHRLASPHYMGADDLAVMIAARIELDAQRTQEGR
jgi:hypothetical protein